MGSRDTPFHNYSNDEVNCGAIARYQLRLTSQSAFCKDPLQEHACRFVRNSAFLRNAPQVLPGRDTTCDLGLSSRQSPASYHYFVRCRCRRIRIAKKHGYRAAYCKERGGHGNHIGFQVAAAKPWKANAAGGVKSGTSTYSRCFDEQL